MPQTELSLAEDGVLKRGESFLALFSHPGAYQIRKQGINEQQQKVIIAGAGCLFSSGLPPPTGPAAFPQRIRPGSCAGKIKRVLV